MGHEVYVTVPIRWGTCADFQLGFWISENSVGNTNTAKPLQMIRKQLPSRRKRSPAMHPGSCLGYTSVFIDLLSVLQLLCDASLH